MNVDYSIDCDNGDRSTGQYLIANLLEINDRRGGDIEESIFEEAHLEKPSAR